MGLVTFNGNASLVVSPTTDRDAVDRGIDGAQLGERTAIGEAIFTCLDALKQRARRPRAPRCRPASC